MRVRIVVQLVRVKVRVTVLVRPAVSPPSSGVRSVRVRMDVGVLVHGT
ncbi:MAG TPA: hypothetical protein VGR43_03650 [Dehalococcoidia bacterium]|nr:hypothetical protein [Dehalococcoidia bacterium]